LAALKFDGLNSAIVGIAERCGQEPLLVYDYHKVVRALEVRDGMSNDEAVEFVDFNIAGAWVGEGTPLMLYRMTPRQALDYLSDDDEESEP
jgi:hypothetical protein